MDPREETEDRGQKAFRGNRSHLRRLLAALDRRDPKTWNDWRKSHPGVKPDLRGIDLRRDHPEGIALGELDLRSARLAGAKLARASGWKARLAWADLRGANLDAADLAFADLRGANLEGGRLVRTNLTMISAERAIFRRANLSHAVMNAADLRGADLRRAKVTGLSSWGVKVDAKTQQDGLVVEELGDFLEDLVDVKDWGNKPRAVGRVDNVDAAHLLYLIRDKRKLTTVIDAMTSNLVLLLGSFGPRRKAILDSLESKLTELGYAPAVFDFKPPVDRDLIETVALLAGLSCFVIADLTRPKSTPLEAMLVVPQIGVPFASIIEKDERPFSMFRSLQGKYEWALRTWSYRSKAHLLRHLKTAVVVPCERMRAKLKRKRKAIKAQPVQRQRRR